MRWTLKIARVMTSVLIGVVVFLWTAEVRVLVSAHVCGPSIQIVCGVHVSLFALWLCALFGAVAAVVVFLIAVLSPRFVFSRLLLVDASDRARMSIQTEWFSPSDLEMLQTTLSVPVTLAPAPVSPRTLNQMYPGAASFALVHRYEAVGILALVALLVIGLLVPGHHG